jgi:hypothetical protein
MFPSQWTGKSIPYHCKPALDGSQNIVKLLQVKVFISSGAVIFKKKHAKMTIKDNTIFIVKKFIYKTSKHLVRLFAGIQ